MDDISAFTGDENVTGEQGQSTAGGTSTAADSLAAEMAGTEGESGQTSTDSPPAWTAQLPKDMLSNAEEFKKISGFKTIGELAKAYISGGGEADYSDVKKVLERLGAPKDGEKYEWEDNLKDDMKGFAETARKAKLTKEQAKAVMEGYVLLDETRVQANVAKVKAAVPKIADDLVKEFGEDALEWHRKAVKDSGLNRELARNGLSANPVIARALVLLGREMTEDYTPSGSSGGRSKAKSILDGATFDYK